MKSTTLILMCVAAYTFLTGFMPGPCFADYWSGVVPLEIVKVLPVDGPENINPSGLAIHNGHLYSVSDKHDGSIFKVEIKDGRALFTEHLTFKTPEGIIDLRGKMFAADGGDPYDPSKPQLDLEGITIDGNGNFFLISERCFCVIKVLPDGTVDWVSPSFYEAGLKRGLFVTDGAGPEAIAFLEEKTLIVSAEREPRGILLIRLDQDPPLFVPFYMNDSGIFHSKKRNPDIASFHVEKGDVWCLGRNSETIFKLIWNEEEYREEDVHFFGHITNRKRYSYQDMKFGMA
ncbi:MAG: esterase-like activity of phytase family protein, partial [bacterium]|nr:esterase-like activity of phytase family protein [bacterium]